MLWLATHVLGLALIAAVAWLSGRALLPETSLPPTLRSLAAWCVGLVYWVVALFALATVGALNPIGLSLALLGLVVLLFRRGWTLPKPSFKPSWTWAFVALLAPFLLLAFARTISPMVFWDDAAYHLTLPRLYIENGGFRPVEMNVYAQWPLATELLFAAAMLVKSYVLAKAVHFGFGLLVIVALFAACRTPWPAALASLLFLASPVVAFELRLAYVDLAHAFFLLAAFVFLEAREHDPENERSYLLLAGLCCGAMAGVKLNGILALPILAVVFLGRLALAKKWQPLVRQTLFLAVPAVLLWIPWLAKAAVATGNPVYPLLFNVFGGPDWSPELADHLAAWHRGIGMGRGPVDFLLLPLRLFLLGEPGSYALFDGTLGAYWLAVIALALLGWRQGPVRRALAVAGLFFLLWSGTSQQARLLVPVLPLIALAGARALEAWVNGWPSRTARAARVAGLVLAAALLVVGWRETLQGGWRNFQAFQQMPGDPTATVIPEHFRFINDNLPEDARLLFLNTNQGFFCHREYLADSFFEASQTALLLQGAETPAAIAERLAQRDVTHILLDLRQRPRGLDYPAALGPFLGDTRWTERLYRSGDGRFNVFAVRGSGLERPSAAETRPSPKRPSL